MEEVDNMNETKELIHSYQELSVKDKRRELGYELTEMTATIEHLLQQYKPDFKMEPESNYMNLFDDKTTEAEYLNGLYEDVLYYENVLNQLLILSTNHTEE